LEIPVTIEYALKGASGPLKLRRVRLIVSENDEQEFHPILGHKLANGPWILGTTP
jgi:hypothetical protein